MRASNSIASSLLKALSSDSIGTPCSTAENCAARAAPTRWLGELSVCSDGKRASISSRSVFLVIAQVMPGQLIGQALQLVRRFGFGEIFDRFQQAIQQRLERINHS